MKKTLLISIFLLSFSLVVFAWSDSTEKINSYFDVSNDIQRKNGSLIIDGGIEAKMQFNVGGLIKKEQQEDEIVFGTIIIGETEEDNVHFHSFLLDGSLAITGGNPEEWKVLTMMDDNPATWEDLVDVADTEGAGVEDQGWVLSGNTLRLVGENDSVLGGTNMQALSIIQLSLDKTLLILIIFLITLLKTVPLVLVLDLVALLVLLSMILLLLEIKIVPIIPAYH